MHPVNFKRIIPWSMAITRAILGPLMILGQTCNWNGLTLAALILAALFSDIFDGILARRWRTDTADLRLFDSMADTVFYLGVALALWLRQPTILRSHAHLFIALLSLESARITFDFAKFGKPASYHSYLAKAWGLILAIAVTAAFATSHGNPLIAAALFFGILCNLEGLTMSLLLTDWQRDIKTLRIAWNMRVAIQQQGRTILRQLNPTGTTRTPPNMDVMTPNHLGS